MVGCSSKNETTQNLDTTSIAEPIAPQKIAVDTISDVDDCVFNNDFKGLTTEWLQDLHKTNFIWRADLYKALLPDGQDTVFISKGGCDHFTNSVELKLANDNHLISDSTFWIQKALELADEFKMKDYSQIIREGRLRKAQSEEARVWYEVGDIDQEDNLYYEGIEITFEPEGKRIGIYQYFN